MLVFMALMQPSFALASAGDTGYSGLSGRNCGACHSGGTVPTVTISGPASATAGSVNSYTFKITGGPLAAGACDIAASGGSLGAATGDTLKNSEISGGPTAPSTGAVSFPFTWTAPATAGTYTLYGCGLSTNGNGGTSGDGVSAIQFTVTVAGATNVSVPNVVGMTQAAATTAITNAKLVLGTVTQQASSTVPAGSVISENPAAGSSVAQNSAVNLVVSSGTAPTSVSVPNVVGMTQAAATTAITNAKLVLGTVTKQTSSTVPAGSVISENPAAGSSVAQNSAVNLTVSTGRPTNSRPPVANAGLDLTVLPGTFNVLSGSYSSDPDNGIASYLWTQNAGPAVKLSDPTAIDPVFQAPTSPTTLSFTLTVTDNGGLQSSDTVSVVVMPRDAPPQPPPANQPPVANAGSNRTVTAGSRVTLSGAASTDPDDGIAAYQWQQVSGTSVTLSGANTVNASFVPPDVGSSGATLTFKLTVTDRGGLSSSATVRITVHEDD